MTSFIPMIFRIALVLIALALAPAAFAQTPADVAKQAPRAPVEDLPLGISFFMPSAEVREKILAFPGAKLLSPPTPGKMVFGHVRLGTFPSDLFVIYDGDSILLMSFQFTRAAYGGSPTLPELVELLMQKYGEPDRIGGDFAAFWARAGGKYMTVAVADTSAGPSVDFTNRLALDRKENRRKAASRPAMK